MKVIIAGSRHITAYSEVEIAMRDCGFVPTMIVSGMARGVDRLGEQWAKRHRVDLARFPAGWRDKDGGFDRNAGFRRNQEMAEFADALVAVWDLESKGTEHMIKCMRSLGKPVHVRLFEEL